MTLRDVLVDAAVVELEECGHAGISLRASARRAGVSHAAPKNHFGDRAGLLTAVAIRGFDDLAARMAAVTETDPRRRLVALGAAYVDHGLTRPAMFDLMWRTVELRTEDPTLRRAQAASIEPLVATADSLAARAAPPPVLTTMAWALVHGLVVLSRDGALLDPADPSPPPVRETAHDVVATFVRMIAALPRGDVAHMVDYGRQT